MKHAPSIWRWFMLSKPENESFEKDKNACKMFVMKKSLIEYIVQKVLRRFRKKLNSLYYFIFCAAFVGCVKVSLPIVL